MDGKFESKLENPASELLAEFQKLFGLISNQDNNDLLALAERVKRLIYRQLVIADRLDSDKSYEEWARELFGATELPKPTLLIEMANKYNLINPEATTEVLKQKLSQMLSEYRRRSQFSLNQALISEIEEALNNSTLSVENYNILAGKLLSKVY